MKEVWIGKSSIETNSKMRISKLNYPFIFLTDTELGDIELNIEEFLDKITPDKNSPYRKILDLEVFAKGYISDDKLIWEDVLELIMCGGDNMWVPVKITKKEILSFLVKET